MTVNTACIEEDIIVNRRSFLLSSVALGALAAAAPTAVFAQEITILGSVPSLSFPFFVHMLNQIKAEAQTQGVGIIESDGQNSAPKQTADIESAIVQKVNAIVISPLDVNALAPAIEQAVQAGVPVVTIDRRVDGVEGILAHVGADNVKGGEAEAQAMVDAFPNGAKIFHLQGQPGAGPAIDRNKGVHNVLDGVKDKYQIIFEQTANFARDQGLSVTEAGLAANGKPDAIICANDDMALGAAEACAARGFTDVKIYGFDALPEALAAVRDGKLAGTVEQFPGEQSRTAVKIAVAYARDKTEPAEKLVLLTPVVIGPDNLDKAERLGEVK
jgi:inositol transport system substrate-binding protein